METCLAASIVHQCGWESMSCMTSLTADGLKGSSMLLNSPISPICQFLDRIMSSGFVFMTVHSRHTGNFEPKILSTGTTERFCCDSNGTDISMKL